MKKEDGTCVIHRPLKNFGLTVNKMTRRTIVVDQLAEKFERYMIKAMKSLIKESEERLAVKDEIVKSGKAATVVPFDDIMPQSTLYGLIFCFISDVELFFREKNEILDDLIYSTFS